MGILPRRLPIWLGKKCSILIITIIILCISACSKEEPVEEEYVPVSSQQDSIESDNLYVSGIGQWTGFNINGDVIEMYPYFDKDLKVNIRAIQISGNNFWYDFITAKGKSMADIKMYPSGAMTLTVDNITYGYNLIDDAHAIFAYTLDLPASYVNLALSHASYNGS